MKVFRSTCLVAAFFIGLCFGSKVLASEIDVRSETIIRGFERSVAEDDEALVVPVYEYLGVDYGDTEQGGLSLHLYGWGRKDLASSDFFQDDPDAELLYGYVRYRKPYSAFTVNLGRQHIFAGVINQSVDGLQLGAEIGTYLSISAFGGLPVDYQDQEGGSADATYGARMAHHLATRYEVGLSYQKTDADDELAEEKAGADLVLHLGPWLTINGLSSYNLESEDWREHNYSAQLLISHLSIEPSYQFFSYRDYFGKGTNRNNIFHFLRDDDESLSIAGTDVVWQGLGPVDVGLRGRQYDYDVRSESAMYMAGLLTLNTADGSQVGIEIGRMDGETIDNIYNLYRGFFYWQKPFKMAATGFISGDALYIAYDASVFGEDKSVQYSVSAGRKFLKDRLETKLSGIYSQDPYFDSDVGGLVTLQIQY